MLRFNGTSNVLLQEVADYHPWPNEKDCTVFFIIANFKDSL